MSSKAFLIRRRWYVAGVATALILFLVLRSLNAGEKGIRYQSAQVTRGSLEVSLVATGVVQPQNRVQVKPPVSGRIEEVLVEEGQEVKPGQVMAWMSSNERAALLDAARSKSEAERKEWETYYRPTPILAPIHGTIIQLLVQTGQSFANSDAVIVLADRLTIKTLVDETDIAQIHNHLAATVELDAYPGQKMQARVEQIAYDAETINSITTYKVDVLPQQAPAYMRSGMTANVTFHLASKQNVVLVPAEAVSMENGHASVLVPSTAGLGPRVRGIEVGATDGKQIEVKGGLTEKDTVLIPEGEIETGGARHFFGFPRKSVAE